MTRLPKEDIETGEVSGVSQYVPLSEERLKQLAIDSLNGQVFGTWMIPEQDANLISSIFMVVALMDDISRKELRRDGIVHLYEEWAKAGPRSINGYPMFMSAGMLNADDCVRLQKKITQVKEALDAI
jgi:hypothetical protein